MWDIPFDSIYFILFYSRGKAKKQWLNCRPAGSTWFMPKKRGKLFTGVLSQAPLSSPRKTLHVECIFSPNIKPSEFIPLCVLSGKLSN